MVKPLEITNCYYCKGNITKQLYTIKGFKDDPRSFNVVQCCECSLVYVNPRYSADENYKMYQEAYYVDKAIDPSGKVRSFITDLENKINDHKIEVNYIKKYKNRGKILDFGSATGFFLEALKGDWDKYAVDISGFAIKNIKDPQVTRIHSTLIDAEFDDNFFDVVYAGHTLDRLIDLKENIAELKRIIKRDGILLLTLPNISSLCSRIFKERFRLLYSNHLVFFSPKTLQRFLAEVGFKIVEIKYPFYKTSFFSWSALPGDIGKIMLQCCFNIVRVKITLTSPPFWGNIMSVIIKLDNAKK